MYLNKLHTDHCPMSSVTISVADVTAWDYSFSLVYTGILYSTLGASVWLENWNSRSKGSFSLFLAPPSPLSRMFWFFFVLLRLFFVWDLFSLFLLFYVSLNPSGCFFNCSSRAIDYTTLLYMTALSLSAAKHTHTHTHTPPSSDFASLSLYLTFLSLFLSAYAADKKGTMW